MKEYESLEKERRQNLKKSIKNIKAFFRQHGIRARDFSFRMNIVGEFHGLKIRDDYHHLPYKDSSAIKKRIESTNCRVDSCHPMFYDGRVCVAFIFSDLKKLCTLAEQMGCMRDSEEIFFYSIDKEVIFFFKYLPEQLQ